MAFPIMAAALGLAEFAPLITRWLSGEANHQIANDVVAIAKKITGTNDPYKAIQSMHENHEFVLAFQKEILKRETELELAHIQERQSARARDAIFIKNGTRNTRADIMVVSAALGLVFCLVALGFYGERLTGEVIGIISTVAGIFGSCLKDAYAFEFGSSRGSKIKDQTVAGLLEEAR